MSAYPPKLDKIATITIFIGLFMLIVILAYHFLAPLIKHPLTVKEEGVVEIIMCPDCKEAFFSELKGGGKIYCALYDFGEDAENILREVNASVLTDAKDGGNYGIKILESGLMHHKFCIINASTVITGSYNPTEGGEISRNNLLVIRSKTLAKNYLAEYAAVERGIAHKRISHRIVLSDFNELYESNEFSKGIEPQRIVEIKNHFCPVDNCEEKALEEINNAQSQVLFLTYSFTSDPIGEALLEAKARGVEVKGICDNRQHSTTFSECPTLDALKWNQNGLLHHKVFIIDKAIVITGSYNPTAAGNTRNRENLLILHSEEIAQIYEREYENIRALVEGS